MSKEPPAVPSSTFFTEELERALLECGFGIMSWEVQPSDGASGGSAPARAKVELLPETDSGKAGVPVQISLSIKGYQVSLPYIKAFSCRSAPHAKIRRRVP